MNVVHLNPPTDVRRPDVSLKRAHADLISRLAAIVVPPIPINIQGCDLVALSLYESAVIETLRRHHREVMDVARANGVPGLDEVHAQAEHMLTDIQSDLIGVFENAAANLES